MGRKVRWVEKGERGLARSNCDTEKPKAGELQGNIIQGRRAGMPALTRCVESTFLHFDWAQARGISHVECMLLRRHATARHVA